MSATAKFRFRSSLTALFTALAATVCAVATPRGMAAEPAIVPLPPVETPRWATPQRDKVTLVQGEETLARVPIGAMFVMQPEPGPTPRTLTIPESLPGAGAPPLRLPPHDPGNPAERARTIDRLFPRLPPLPSDPRPQPSPEQPPLTLEQLENMALAASPVIRQAMADITAARGAAIQAGLPPNPTVGYEGDTIGSGGTANYHGPYFNIQIKTAGKLQLARAALSIDIRNAELTLQKVRVALVTQVQARYFAVKVAEEAMIATEALARFTDEAYRIQIEQLRGGEAAAYEPMQLRVLAMQARGSLIQARNRYNAAWKQLSSVVNSPGMPPAPLTGDLNIAMPTVRFDLALAQTLARHPDILAARNSEAQARVNLRLAEITPVPDISLYSTVQKDFTTTPFGNTFNVQAGIPVPILDRNQGGIMQAEGQLIRARQQEQRVRNELQAALADAFERYENSRAVLEYYRVLILPDQARAYRGVYERHQQQPDRVSFGDVVNAQQTLALTTNNYLAALGSQWVAVTDLLNIMQVETIDELRQVENVPPPPPDAPAAQ